MLKCLYLVLSAQFIILRVTQRNSLCLSVLYETFTYSNTTFLTVVPLSVTILII